MSSFHRGCLFGAICVAVAACQPAPSLSSPTAPPDVRDACALTVRRCTQCHDRGRIVDAHLNRDEWASTIERMRQMPGSTIAPYETDTILHCLLSRNAR